MLFAEYSVAEWIGIIAAGIGTISTALFVAYKLFRQTKTTVDEEDGKMKRTARKEDMAIDSEALYKIIDDLRAQNAKSNDYVTTLQNSALVKIIEAHDEHHECEKKYAALEVKYQNVTERADREEARADCLDQKVTTLEDRIKLLEGRK